MAGRGARQFRGFSSHRSPVTEVELAVKTSFYLKRLDDSQRLTIIMRISNHWPCHPRITIREYCRNVLKNL
jgi:hypothetical protein